MKKSAVCIITYSPLGKAAVTPLSNLIKIFRAMGTEIYLISGGDLIEDIAPERNVHVLNVVSTYGPNPILRIFNHLCMQLKVLSYVLSTSFRCQTHIIFLGEVLITPLLALKIRRKKLILMLGITPSKEQFVTKRLFSELWLLFSNINARFADRLIVYSNKIIQDANLVRYRHKTVLAYEHSVDFTKFHIDKSLAERDYIIGFIGRLTEVKGIINFVKAISLLSEKKNKASFLIAGTGELYSEIERFIRANRLKSQVTLAGWIPHEDLPNTLNKLKLLVLPSYSEALPNVMLEAMACGTPVLATTVGGIPDIVKDGETGLLLNSNDPYHIAKKIAELIDDPELLEKVSKNAYKLVRNNFGEELTLRTWQKLLGDY